MSILLPALAVAFAAFCVWLGVRIVNRRERWAKWTLLMSVGLPVLYFLSFGPACWWFSEPISFQGVRGKHVSRFYLPIGWIENRVPRRLSTPIRWYATTGLKADDSLLGCDFGRFDMAIWNH
jgi:hypothetical protein